jgi:hypothetical protein
MRQSLHKNKINLAGFFGVIVAVGGKVSIVAGSTERDKTDIGIIQAAQLEELKVCLLKI